MDDELYKPYSEAVEGIWNYFIPDVKLETLTDLEPKSQLQVLARFCECIDPHFTKQSSFTHTGSEANMLAAYMTVLGIYTHPSLLETRNNFSQVEIETIFAPIINPYIMASGLMSLQLGFKIEYERPAYRFTAAESMYALELMAKRSTNAESNKLLMFEIIKGALVATATEDYEIALNNALIPLVKNHGLFRLPPELLVLIYEYGENSSLNKYRQEISKHEEMILKGKLPHLDWMETTHIYAFYVYYMAQNPDKAVNVLCKILQNPDTFNLVEDEVEVDADLEWDENYNFYSPLTTYWAYDKGVIYHLHRFFITNPEFSTPIKDYLITHPELKETLIELLEKISTGQIEIAPAAVTPLKQVIDTLP